MKLTRAAALALTLSTITFAQQSPEPQKPAPNPSFGATFVEPKSHPEEKKVVPPLRDATAALITDDQPWAREQKLWALLKAKDLTTLQTMLLPDFAYVADTVSSGPELVEYLATCTVASYTLTANQTHMASPSVAVLTYTATEDITCGTDHQTDTLNIAAVWVKRDNTWLAQLHTETPIKTK